MNGTALPLYVGHGTKCSVAGWADDETGDSKEAGHGTDPGLLTRDDGRVDSSGASGGGLRQHLKEQASGAKTDRPELAKAIRRLEAGDVLVVTRLDRLARSTRDLLNILDAVAKAGASFKSLADAWADTTTPHGKL